MKKKLPFAVMALVLLLTSCGQPAASPTPTEVAPEPTAAVEPTATPTEAVPVPTATIEPTPTEEPSVEPKATFEQADCPFDVPAGAPVECGFVVVPQDHTDPTGPTIRLAIAVFKDQSTDHQPDPVILLTGGPGDKTMHVANLVAQIFAPAHPNRDFIVFDQRGVGLSQPALECPEWEDALFDLLDEPDPDVIPPTLFDALMACRDRLVNDGHDLSAYNTFQNAADVNALRKALGYDQVNLYGASYGSFLAQAVMRDHPEAIRSVTINSVWPLEISLVVDTPTRTTDAIMRLLDACAADEACNTAYPNLQDVLFETIDRLNAEAVPITVTSPVDGQDYDVLLNGDEVIGNLVAVLYITPLIPALPQAIYDVYNGDYGLMTQLTGQKLALYGALSRGMQYSVICTEDLIGRTPEELLEAEMTIPRQLRGQTDPELEIEYGIFGICENWPVEQADAWVKEPLVSDIPTLILEGELDPVTPPEFGRLVAGHLQNSHYFEFPGIGHRVLPDSECAQRIAAAFIDNPTTAPDATCMSDLEGIAFDVPREATAVVMEPVTYQEHGFSGLMPAGWTEGPPLNFKRGLTALDPTTFVQDAVPMAADELFGLLSGQLGFDPGMESVASTRSGTFVWDFFAFAVQGYPTDLALAEDGRRAYFVLLVSAPDERDALYDQIFLPAVEALTPLE